LDNCPEDFIFAALKIVAMPKMKTHSSAKKRFKVTGSGKVKRFHAFTSHMMRNKSKKAKLRLRDAGLVSEADEARIKRLLCL
jgi:large subunit ribosomal protein L35